MTICSIDLEMTGLNPKENQIIEFAAILESTNRELDFNDLPKFTIYVDNETLNWTPEAKKMNKRVIKKIDRLKKTKNEKYNYEVIKNKFQKENQLKSFDESFWKNITNVLLKPHQIGEVFKMWLIANGVEYSNEKYKKEDEIHLTIAGKNFATVDLRFIEEHLGESFLNQINVNKSIIDPAIYYYEDGDEYLPGMKKCKIRAGIGDKVSHRAIEDAYDVILLLREKSSLYKKNRILK